MVKNPPANARDMGSIPRLGRCPGKGNGNPLQHSCLGNPTDSEAWRVAVCGVARVGHDLATKQQQRGEFTLYKCFLCVSHTHLCACVYVGMYTYVCLYVMKCRRMAANED